MSDNKKTSVAKIIAYSVAVFLFAVFQSSVASRFKFFGATPSYLLVLTAAAAFFDGEKTGALVGLGAGFCADALGGVGISVLPVFYTILGWIIGVGVSNFGHRQSTAVFESLLRWAVWLIASCGIGMIITVICLFVSAGEIYVFSVIWRIAIPEAIGTFLFGYSLGIVFMLIYKNKER